VMAALRAPSHVPLKAKKAAKKTKPKKPGK
jgi:hypothetical protein